MCRDSQTSYSTSFATCTKPRYDVKYTGSYRWHAK